MKKLPLLFFLKSFIYPLLSTFTLKAQFAIVNDKDGFCNVRSSAAIANNVMDRLPNGTLVYCLDIENNFTNIDYIKNKAIKNGYVYNSKLLMIDSFVSIPESSRKDSSIVLKHDSIEVIITEKNSILANTNWFFTMAIQTSWNS